MALICSPRCKAIVATASAPTKAINSQIKMRNGLDIRFNYLSARIVDNSRLERNSPEGSGRANRFGQYRNFQSLSSAIVIQDSFPSPELPGFNDNLTVPFQATGMEAS